MANVKGKHKQLVPFKKGEDERRNITGANKGSKWLTTELDEALRAIGEGNKDPYHVMLIKRLMKKAIVEGDMRAIELIWDRLEGGASLDELKGSTITNFTQIVINPPHGTQNPIHQSN